jgi:hypothetical protein
MNRVFRVDYKVTYSGYVEVKADSSIRAADAVERNLLTDWTSRAGRPDEVEIDGTCEMSGPRKYKLKVAHVRSCDVCGGPNPDRDETFCEDCKPRRWGES